MTSSAASALRGSERLDSFVLYRDFVLILALLSPSAAAALPIFAAPLTGTPPVMLANTARLLPLAVIVPHLTPAPVTLLRLPLASPD
ncbi:hypothetical protein MHYP_G00262410 [Metynnis hypsauchen]